jgi:hypothetical protein
MVNEHSWAWRSRSNPASFHGCGLSIRLSLLDVDAACGFLKEMSITPA